MLEALWQVDMVGSVAKPNWRISFFLINSVAVFSCQEHCAVSDLICFVREMVFCFHFLTWYCCCFQWLFLGFQIFFIWFELGCLKSLSLGNCFIGLGVVLGQICFSLRHLFCFQWLFLGFQIFSFGLSLVA